MLFCAIFELVLVIDWFGGWMVGLIGTFLLLMVVKIVLEIKRQNFITFYSMSLLVVPFLLSMNIFVHVGFVIAERNLYLSVVGHSLLVAKGAYNLVNGEIFIGYLEIEIYRPLNGNDPRPITENSDTTCYVQAPTNFTFFF